MHLVLFNVKMKSLYNPGYELTEQSAFGWYEK